VERFILPALGALKFSKVTEPVLNQFFERIDEFDRADPLRKTHVGVTDSQVNTVKKLLKALFRWAQKEGYVLGNPAANLRQTHVEPAERTIYSPEEFEFLLHYVNSYYRPHLMVLYWSSIRPAELGALSWDEDIDFRSDGRVDLRIRHQLSSKVVGPTKTLKSKRLITLPMFIADALREHKEVQERTHKPHPQGLVFTTSAGNTFDNDRFRIRILYKAEELANKARVAQGLEPLPKVSPYGFRHSTLTVYSDVGASLPEAAIQQHAGHTSQRTTDLYVHPDGKRREALAEIMESEHDAVMGKVLRGPDKGTA
jgi:integrase